MASKWIHLKPEAIRLRKQGRSLPYVHTHLGIPKSTLSHWFKDITLTEKQKAKLQKNWQDGLAKAREKAVLLHNKGKQERLQQAESEAMTLLQKT